MMMVMMMTSAISVPPAAAPPIGSVTAPNRPPVTSCWQHASIGSVGSMLRGS